MRFTLISSLQRVILCYSVYGLTAYNSLFNCAMNRPTFRASLYFSMEPYRRFNAAVYIRCNIRPLQTQYTDLIVSASHCQREKLFMRKYILKSSRYASAEHVSSSSTMRTRSIRFGLALCRGESPSPRETRREKFGRGNLTLNGQLTS